MGKTRDLFKKTGEIKGIFHVRMGKIKDRNGKYLTEAEQIKKRWQEYTKELYKKDLNDLDNCNGVVTCLVKWVWRQVGLRKHHYKQSKWRRWNSSWAISNPKRWCCESAALNVSANLENSAVATGLEKLFSFQSQRKAMPKNDQTTVQLPSVCLLVRLCSKSFKLGF